MFNNENTPSITQLVHSLSSTNHALRTVSDPELRVALLGVIQSLSEALYDACDVEIEELFDDIPVREDSTTPPLACQVDD